MKIETGIPVKRDQVLNTKALLDEGKTTRH